MTLSRRSEILFYAGMEFPDRGTIAQRRFPLWVGLGGNLSANCAFIHCTILISS